MDTENTWAAAAAVGSSWAWDTSWAAFAFAFAVAEVVAAQAWPERHGRGDGRKSSMSHRGWGRIWRAFLVEIGERLVAGFVVNDWSGTEGWLGVVAVLFVETG